MKVLIVDDEKNIREVVKEYAFVEGIECLEAANGLKAVELVRENYFDLVVLDIMMPIMDGFEAFEKIRKFSNVPVLFLTARHEEFDKLKAFDLGVDDYVTKPFSPRELMARIRAIYSRTKGFVHPVYRFSGLIIDGGAKEVYIDQELVTLTPKEFELLIYLVQHQNINLSREILLKDVWNYKSFVDERTVDTHIKMLRQNLKEYRRFIVTVRGIGYRFEV